VRDNQIHARKSGTRWDKNRHARGAYYFFSNAIVSLFRPFTFPRSSFYFPEIELRPESVVFLPEEGEHFLRVILANGQQAKIISCHSTLEDIHCKWNANQISNEHVVSIQNENATRTTGVLSGELQIELDCMNDGIGEAGYRHATAQVTIVPKISGL